MENGAMREPVGCLLLHGYGGSPYEMQGLADRLRQQGCEVEVPVLPGHGKTLEALQATGFQDWLDTALQAYDHLAARTGPCFVLGLSMGGALSLAVAQQRRPTGIITVAAPVFLYRYFPFQATDWRLPFVPLLRFFRPMWPTGTSSEQARQIAPWQGYEGAQPLHALTSFLRGLRSVRSALPRITCPICVLHAEGDRTVLVDNAWEILSQVRSTSRRLELFSLQETMTSHHVLTTHQETRARVAEVVLEFITTHLSP